MRPIDADAAIIAVSDKEIGMVTPWHMGLKRGLNFAIEKINALPTIQPEPYWIPVSERLPEEDGFYLVTVNCGGAACVHESYFMQCNSRSVHWDYPDVTAWIPMPEHYKGELR